MKFELVIPVLAMRKEAGHRSELINQILFGETIEVLDQLNEWAFVKTLHDEHKGWIEFKDFYFRKKITSHPLSIIDTFEAIVSYDGNKMHIPFGSFLDLESMVLLKGSCTNNTDLTEILHTIKTQLLGAPYLWGGRTGFGMDCSGLTQLFYRLLQISIPRDSIFQAGVGDDIFLSQSKPGDLLFYENAEKRIVHVGIALDNQSILHASGNVRIDEYDNKGIFNKTLKTYTHSFAFAKRIIRHV